MPKNSQIRKARMSNERKGHQVVSRSRVTNYGEVYTGDREVASMLDLVKQETERIESRFLEPACGTGNFLLEVLRRKLSVVRTKYRRVQLDYERNGVIAISSLYGVDILEDNILECRNRLLDLFDAEYKKVFGLTCKQECHESAQYILSQNILWGDSLTLKTVCDSPTPLVFPEWSPVNSRMIKRRDFEFGELLDSQKSKGHMDLWNPEKNPGLKSDEGEDIFLPRPIKEYPLIHFLEVSNA